MADERYKGALEAAVEEVDKLLAVVAEKKRFANMLAPMAGVDPPYADVESPSAIGGATIRADQFTSIGAPSVAAREYLKIRGREKGAATFEHIYDALVRGGFIFSKGDSKAGLKIAMGKDEKLIKLPNEAYGLREWYGGAKKLDREKKGGAPADEGGDDDLFVSAHGESPAPPEATAKEEKPV
jgi:hypothetical protein